MRTPSFTILLCLMLSTLSLAVVPDEMIRQNIATLDQNIAIVQQNKVTLQKNLEVVASELTDLQGLEKSYREVKGQYEKYLTALNSEIEKNEAALKNIKASKSSESTKEPEGNTRELWKKTTAARFTAVKQKLLLTEEKLKNIERRELALEQDQVTRSNQIKEYERLSQEYSAKKIASEKMLQEFPK